MSDATTETVELSLTREVADMLRALNTARNGSLHNTANAALRRGINVELALGPESLRDRYTAAIQGAALTTLAREGQRWDEDT